jgi:hypothetical protein
MEGDSEDPVVDQEPQLDLQADPVLDQLITQLQIKIDRI